MVPLATPAAARDRPIAASDADGLRRAVSCCAPVGGRLPDRDRATAWARRVLAKAVAEVYRLKNRPSLEPADRARGDRRGGPRAGRAWPDGRRTGRAVLARPADPGRQPRAAPAGVGARPHDRDPDAGARGGAALLERGRAAARPRRARTARRRISPPDRRARCCAACPSVPLVLDGGPARWGIESTVLDLTAGAHAAAPGRAGPARAARGDRRDRAAVEPRRTRTTPARSPGDEPPALRARAGGDPRRGRARRGPVRPGRPRSAALTYETDRRRVRRGPDRRPARGTRPTSTPPCTGWTTPGSRTIIVQDPPATEDWLAVRDRTGPVAGRRRRGFGAAGDVAGHAAEDEPWNGSTAAQYACPASPRGTNTARCW